MVSGLKLYEDFEGELTLLSGSDYLRSVHKDQRSYHPSVLLANVLEYMGEIAKVSDPTLHLHKVPSAVSDDAPLVRSQGLFEQPASLNPKQDTP